MLGTAWSMTKETVYEFIDDSALSRGAAIAYYTLFSLAPILVIVIAIAGFVFGQDAAQGALVGQLRGFMGQQGADLVQSMVKGASNKHSGTIATVIGIITLVITSTGVFSELQADLNAIWKAQPPTNVMAIVKTRALGLGLVATLGLLLLVLLVVSAAITGLSHSVNQIFPGAAALFQIADFVLSFILVAVMFGAIYKILPDKNLSWRDVGIGAVATAVLFAAGKFLIGLYIGSSAIASSYGAAGTALVLLVWIYYSALIFLLGAEFTKVNARHRGSPLAPPAPGTAQPSEPTPTAASTPRQVAIWSGRQGRRPFGAVDVMALGVLAVALLRGRERS